MGRKGAEYVHGFSRHNTNRVCVVSLAETFQTQSCRVNGSFVVWVES